MSMIGRRKEKEELSRTGKYIRDREEKGLPLPPTMRRGTIDYIKSSYWQTMKQRTSGNKEFVDSARNRAYKKQGVKLLLTKQEFDIWVEENWHKFQALYDSGKIPSIDRINKNRDYTIDNMDVIDLKENMAKDRRKPVAMINTRTKESRVFDCAVDAARILQEEMPDSRFNRNGISRSARTATKHCGYKWEFVEK